MKYSLKHLKNNVLIKISSLNAVSVLVTAITSLVGVKVVALVLGTEGMALIGNLRNALTTVQSASTLGMYNGIVKYIAEYTKDRTELARMLSTVVCLFMIAVCCVALGLFIGASYWNTLLFGTSYHFESIFKALAFALPFYALHSVGLAIINGFAYYKKYIVISIISSIAGLLVSVLLIWYHQLQGAFIAVIGTPIVGLVIITGAMRTEKELLRLISIHHISFTYVKKMSSYAVMTLVSAVILPLIMIRVRNHIIATAGIDEAGYWEAIQRISKQYMVFITTLLTLYVLPKFATIKRSKAFRKEVTNFYKVMLPIFGVGFIGVYGVRHWIVALLFSADFSAMESQFGWYLMGDFFKIASLVIAYQLIAKKMLLYYMITEVLSLLLLYLSSIYLINRYGFIGASMAHFFNYVCYFIMMIIVFRNSLFGADKKI